MKAWNLLLLVALVLGPQTFASFVDPVDVNHRALSFEIHGKNGGFDNVAYEDTRRQISTYVADGTIDRFLVYRYYINGGFAACVELSLTALPSRLQELLTRFAEIHYNPDNTTFYVGTEPHCG